MHGSDVAYTVKPDRERFLPYAIEGLAAPAAILVGSRHIATELVALTGEVGLMDRVRLAPPGVDTELFHPVPAASREPILRALEARLAAAAPGPFGRNPSTGAAAIAELASAGGPRVLYVGKLIVQKGIELLLESWPAVHERVLGSRLCIVGFGELEAEVAQAAANSGGSIVFAGCADAQVVPSIFPEAFGMVAAEAAASGALPVCANHSGLAEVAGAIADAIGGELASCVRFELGPAAATDLARALGDLLAADAGERARAGALARGVCVERWSWDRVAGGIVAAARGDLSRLRQVGE
jgi:glycosyltransferase involved in cell wall biosynthesis